MSQYSVEDILPDLLATVPEIRDEYQKMSKEGDAALSLYTQEDHDTMREIQETQNLSARRPREPGLNIVLENLLVPMIIKISSAPADLKRLTEIMDWIEQLARSDVFHIRNYIATGICEPLITNKDEHLPGIVPFMGQSTRSLCTMQFPMYRITDETRRLFEEK